MKPSLVLALISAAFLSGCERLKSIRIDPPGTFFDFPRKPNVERRVVRVVAVPAAVNDNNALRLANERFSADGRALWDGRPSFGGIWVASPDATNPERVLITNRANGRQVLGALFRREVYFDGPPIQLSSEAASALGAQAGMTIDVTVVAVDTTSQ